MMIRLISAALMSIIAFPAFSADFTSPLSSETSNLTAPTRWTGYYAGIHGGWANSQAKLTDYSGSVEFEDDFTGAHDWLSDDSYILGVTAGYNFQRGNWIFGPELELGYLNGSDQACYDCLDQLTFKFDNIYGLAAGRVGYATQSTLIYAKAGLAATKISHGAGEMEEIDEWGEAVYGSSVRKGLALGGGIEFALDAKTSFKTEYMYMDFGKKTHSIDNEAFGTFKANVHTLKFGLNYKF